MSFTNDFSAGSFFAYLVDRLELSGLPLPESHEWSRFGNTIGATALRLNLLTTAQIDNLVETQEAQGGYFGELAIKKGLLTPAQVGHLLEIQSVHDDLFLAEQLVVDGKLDLPTLLHSLAHYVSAAEVEPAAF